MALGTPPSAVIHPIRDAGRRIRKTLAALLSLLLAGALAACGLGTAGGYTPSGTPAGPLEGIELDGATVSVGSKNFTEQIILGKMAVSLFESAGAQVQDLTNAPGSNTSREAMLAGDMTFAWEYTGTAWVSYMAQDDPIPDERAQYEAVRDKDLADNNLVWLPPAPMNNTYGFAMTRANADRLGISALSEVSSIPESEQSFCVESEFASRNDGFQPMLETYDIAAPPADRVSTLDTGAVYAATAGGTCTFGEVFTTDGRILALDLVVLEDDRQFFPKYNLSGVVNGELLDEYPQIADLLAPVSEKLTNDVLLELNAKVDVDGGDPAEVAFDWLTQEGFIEG